VRFEVARFVVQGNTLLPSGEVESILAAFRGPGREFADVQRAVEALQQAYAKRGYTMVRVALPEQELDRGVVRLRVVEARIGRVTVEGNRFFDEANIRASLPGLREGEMPNVARLSANLAQANENPAKKTTMRMQGGGAEGEVDARLIVADEKPWAIGLNVDNTGSPATGRTMVGVVYQNSNLFNRDHVLGLQYTTTAEKPDQVSVYGAGYHVPIYSLGDSFDVYASYSDVNSGSGRNPQTQEGGFPTRYSWGYRVAARADYNSVLGTSFNVSPRIAFNHDVNGITPGPGGNFLEGRKSLTLGLQADYLSNWVFDLSYTAFWAGGRGATTLVTVPAGGTCHGVAVSSPTDCAVKGTPFNQIGDRDFASFTVKYSF